MAGKWVPWGAAQPTGLGLVTRVRKPAAYFLPGLPPPAPDLVNVEDTVDAGTLLDATAFFGFLTSRLERVWPLAMSMPFAVSCLMRARAMNVEMMIWQFRCTD